MLSTDLVRLRARTLDDAPALFELRNDVATHLLAEDAPFVPKSIEAIRARLEREVSGDDSSDRYLPFAAESVATGEFIGGGSLWDIDMYSRNAHIGISLMPSARGQGYGRDVVKLLVGVAFQLRNLHRVQLETMRTNPAMQRVAESLGFTVEGTQREHCYDGTDYVDMITYGLLRSEWKG